MEKSKIVDEIFQEFALDNDLYYYAEYNTGWQAWMFFLKIPGTKKFLPFSLRDEKAMDITYMAKLRDNLYDTLKERLADARL